MTDNRPTLYTILTGHVWPNGDYMKTAKQLSDENAELIKTMPKNQTTMTIADIASKLVECHAALDEMIGDGVVTNNVWTALDSVRLAIKALGEKYDGQGRIIL